jgi:RHS repeat-associated protein
MELLSYFYHPDHLGSSSWITDNTGRPIQHLHYLPFGEDWVDQRNSSWNAPYTFSGKEKDVETGYGYFGARYYDSGLSIWLSVDPMSDKYPSMSPYNYCANNPVILVDPDGEDPIYAKNFWGTVKKIGDDGRCGSGSYLVSGPVKRAVKEATKAGQFYTGSLAPSDFVIKIPTGQIQKDVQKTYNDCMESGNSSASRVEYGGHSLYGDMNARLWDRGTPREPVTTDNGNSGYKWSITPFKINGRFAPGGPLSQFEFIWHIQPVGSNPSKADFDAMGSWRSEYNGNPFVIGVESETVTFYNDKIQLISVSYDEFIKMGNQEDIK